MSVDRRKLKMRTVVIPKMFRFIICIYCYMIGIISVNYVKSHLSMMSVILATIVTTILGFVIPMVGMRKHDSYVTTVFPAYICFLMGLFNSQLNEYLTIIIFSLMGVCYIMQPTKIEKQACDIINKVNNDPAKKYIYNQIIEKNKEYEYLNTEEKILIDELSNKIPSHEEYLNSEGYKKIVLFEDWYTFDDNILQRIIEKDMEKYIINSIKDIDKRIENIHERKSIITEEVRDLFIKLNE